MIGLKLSNPKYPVGTSVQAFAASDGQQNRHHEGKPSGTAAATATVGADGLLSFPTLPQGRYVLYAEVAGSPANVQAGNEDFTPPPARLLSRIAARRVAVGV